MKGLSAWARDRCAPGISQANFARDDEDDTASPCHYVPSTERSDFRSDLHGHRQHGRATLEGRDQELAGDAGISDPCTRESPRDSEP